MPSRGLYLRIKPKWIYVPSVIFEPDSSEENHSSWSQTTAGEYINGNKCYYQSIDQLFGSSCDLLGEYGLGKNGKGR